MACNTKFLNTTAISISEPVGKVQFVTSFSVMDNIERKKIGQMETKYSKHAWFEFE